MKAILFSFEHDLHRKSKSQTGYFIDDKLRSFLFKKKNRFEFIKSMWKERIQREVIRKDKTQTESWKNRRQSTAQSPARIAASERKCAQSGY